MTSHKDAKCLDLLAVAVFIVFFLLYLFVYFLFMTLMNLCIRSLSHRDKL